MHEYNPQINHYRIFSSLDQSNPITDNVLLLVFYI